MDFENELEVELDSLWSMPEAVSSLEGFMGLENPEFMTPPLQEDTDSKDESIDSVFDSITQITPPLSARSDFFPNLPEELYDYIPSPEYEPRPDELQLMEQELELLSEDNSEQHIQSAQSAVLSIQSISQPAYSRLPPVQPIRQQYQWRNFNRRQSISKMPLAQLYQIMGLSHDHSCAKDREERIMRMLQESGFQIGQKTWIRDTEEPFRRAIIEKIYSSTKGEYGYSKHLLEAIIRRGTYARMQSNLRRKRRHMSRMNRRGIVFN